jgi:filamentous hemagglutinin family protein
MLVSRRPTFRFPLLRRTATAVAVLCCFAPLSAFSNPTGPTVVNGTAAIVPMGPTLQITNSPNAIINWQRFSIGTGETTRFLQQSPASAVLNRVTTPLNPSVILGTLQSNGRVFLVNPGGIVFGKGAQVDVAGLIASSLNLSNEDFLAGQLRFTETHKAGPVVNQGAITTQDGGQVYLVGSGITNGGVITSPHGEVLLAAGKSVELVDPQTPNLRVEIVAPRNRALNLGEIVADAGRVGIYAGLIRNRGRVQATTALAGESGNIQLRATKNVYLDPTGTIVSRAPSSSDASSTLVDIEAGGDIRITGTRGSDPASLAISAEPGQARLVAGGSIVMKKAATVSAGQLTMQTTTPGETITESPDSSLLLHQSLLLRANGDVSLPGRNDINFLTAYVDGGGDFRLDNYAQGNTSLSEAVLTGGGSLVLNYFGGIPLPINGNVHAGRVAINNVAIGDMSADGSDIVISPNFGSSVSASGPLSINVGGSVIVQGGNNNFDAFAAITGGGPVRINAGSDLRLAGGPLIGTYALLQGRSVNLTVGGLLALDQGAGAGSSARIQTQSTGTPINVSFPNLASGGYFVNGVEGRVQDGMTGFFSGTTPAVPGQTLLIDYGASP